VDTPGMYSLSPITEEERVSRQLLMQERPDLVVHVVDAKNLQRMLPLTLQLLEAGFEVVLMLNMMDEADKIGFRIDSIELQRRLGIPVIPAACLNGRGIDTHRDNIHDRIGA
jgi:ferrous iron transport protein B